MTEAREVEWGVRFPSGAVESYGSNEGEARRFALVTTSLRPDMPTLVVRQVVTAWEVADQSTQPPVCPDHREAQHRDNRPPWCDSCGWRHGEPARRYGNGRVVA